jgi:signal transduction histidine kinase
MYGVVLLAIVCAANLLLAAFVLSSNHRATLNRVFSVLAMALALWSGVTYAEDTLWGHEFIRALGYVDFLLAVLMMGLFYWFCQLLSKSSAKFNKWLALLGAVNAGLIVAGLSIDVRLEGGEVRFVEQPGFVAFGVFSLLALIGGLFLLAQRFRRSHGREKAQVQLIFVGLFLSSLGLITTNLILPNILTVGPTVTRLGIYSILFLTGASAYAIVKHRFMDIRLIVARSVAYTLLLTTLATLYGGAVFGVSSFIFPGSQTSSGQNLLYIALAIVLAFTFQPLRRFFEKLTDKVFYRDHYDTQEVLNKIGTVLASEIVLERVLDKTLDIICTDMRLATGQFMIFEKGRLYKVAHFGQLPGKLLTVPELHELNARMIVADELTGGKRKQVLDAHAIRLSMRLRTKEEFVGFLLLGDKQSGDIYSNQDTEMLEIMSHELAVAIVNAKAYEEIKQFNLTLQDKVDKATARLRVANRHLKELDEAKDEFISMASHQLRTPLTSIKGYLSMLLEGDVDNNRIQQIEFMNYAFEASDRMVHLISDLLNVSRMSAGRFHIDRKPTDLAVVVEDEVRSLNTHAEAKGLALKYTRPKVKIPPISVDDEKTRQVIMNFIDNAIYYTKHGSVTVTLDKVGDDVVFKVKDTGIGVPKEAQSKLFTKFYRAGNAQGVRPDGTGLGLYLAKRVIADQGGKIIFESQEGKGSTFGFILPIAPAPAKPKKELAHA